MHFIWDITFANDTCIYLAGLCIKSPALFLSKFRTQHNVTQGRPHAMGNPYAKHIHKH